MRYPKELIAQKMDSLPEPVQRLLGSTAAVDAIIEIGKKYQLHIDATNILSEEMSLVLFGLEKPQDFSSNLRKYLGVSSDVANLITYDVNQQIFSKIRKELEDLSQIKDKTAPNPQTFNQKMSGVTNVPKQEVAVTPQTGDNKVRDPYREPI